MNKNIGRIVIIILILIVIGFLGYLFKDDLFSAKIVFQLNGEVSVLHNLNDEYHDLGVTATKGDTDLSSEVRVENNVDVTKEGTYVITYTFRNETLVRNVTVKRINSFTMNGPSDVYILLNGTYPDPKVEAIYNEVDSSDKVVITNNYDATKVGDYTIEYYFDKMAKTLTRNIHVRDFDDYLKIDYDASIMQKTIEIKTVMDKEKTTKYQLPDSSMKQNDASFIVTKNGTYNFIVYDQYGNSLTKTIEIKNILDDIEASCTAVVKDDTTTITVTTNNNITKYIYNGKESTKKTYTFKKAYNSNKVVLYDNYNQSKEITCKTSVVKTNKLEIHFIATGFYDDGILIKSNEATIYIDGGRGADKVVKYLQKIGVSKIDYVIGSHTEYDHIDAQADVIARFNVKNVLYPNDIYNCGCSCDSKDVGRVKKALNDKKMKAKVQSVPSRLQVGDMTLYFIAPFKIQCNKNNNSFVFILKFVNNYFMFTGDADSDLHSVSGLTANAKKLGLSSIHADVIKYPHHGNETLDGSFITAVNPKYFIVPNYGAAQHPSRTFISNMNSKGIKVYRQSDSKTGNVLITSNGNSISFTMDV